MFVKNIRGPDSFLMPNGLMKKNKAFSSTACVDTDKIGPSLLYISN